MTDSVFKAERTHLESHPFKVSAPAPRVSAEVQAERTQLERSTVERIARQARTLNERSIVEKNRLIGAAREDVDRLLAAARLEAAGIVEEGKRGLAALEAEACVRGEARGFEEGLGRAAAAAEVLVATLEAAAAEARAARRRALDAAREGLVDVAVETARRIMRREAATDRGLVVEILDAALEKVRNAERIKVRVNVGDLGAAEAIGERVRARMRSAHGVEVVEDPSVEAGGCVVETEFGRVDARLRAQLDEIERSMRAVEADFEAPPGAAGEAPSAPTVS